MLSVRSVGFQCEHGLKCVHNAALRASAALVFNCDKIRVTHKFTLTCPSHCRPVQAMATNAREV